MGCLVPVSWKLYAQKNISENKEKMFQNSKDKVTMSLVMEQFLYPLTRKEEQRVKTVTCNYTFRRNTHWWDQAQQQIWSGRYLMLQTESPSNSCITSVWWHLPVILWEIWAHTILRRVSTQTSYKGDSYQENLPSVGRAPGNKQRLKKAQFFENMSPGTKQKLWLG